MRCSSEASQGINPSICDGAVTCEVAAADNPQPYPPELHRDLVGILM